MTNTELKEALIKEIPVMYDGIVYKCVSAIIYRKIDNQPKVIAELLDKNINSITIAPADKVTEVTDEHQ